MIRENRIGYFAPADYSEGKELDNLIKLMIDKAVFNEQLEEKKNAYKKEASLAREKSEEEQEKSDLLAALKTGKTLDYINQENEIQEEKKRKEDSKKEKQTEEFKITAKQLLDEKVATVKKYLEKGDYQSVNKYLRTLSNYYTYHLAFDTLNSDNNKWGKVINGKLCTIIDTRFPHELVKNYVFNVHEEDFVHYSPNYTNLSRE
ncbi:hypothetical protein K1I96_12490, partial [Streptococcus sanguinis]|nr:hypothetical protein [Streptococcus sanguinis]